MIYSEVLRACYYATWEYTILPLAHPTGEKNHNSHTGNIACVCLHFAGIIRFAERQIFFLQIKAALSC